MTTLTADDHTLPDGNDPTEPLRCPNCGNLITYYSPGSDANLLCRCDKCCNDYNISLLREGTVKYKRRGSRKASAPKGH